MDDLEFLPVTVVTRARPEERQAMRYAVVQVLRDLLIERVPSAEKVPLFEKAYVMIEQAGWGLDELIEAVEPGPRQEHLFQILQI